MTIAAHEVRRAFGNLLEQGDEVLIHASMGRHGKFEAGVDDIVTALLEAVGPDGTVIVMTDTRSFSKTGSYCDNQPSETGLLTERFRMTEGAIRSQVPMVSFAAIGPLANYYTQAYHSHLDTTATITRLLDRDGKIMLMGVGYEKCTLYHLAEERHETPYNFYKNFEGVLVDDEGKEIGPISQKYYVRQDMSVTKNPWAAGALLEERGLALKDALGDGHILTFKARDFDACCMEVLDKNLNAFIEPAPGSVA